MGCPDEEIDRQIEQEEAQYEQALTQWRRDMRKHRILVWPENWEAVQLFLTLSMDWIKPNAMGGSYRLPTTEIEAAMRISGVKNRKNCWQQIQLMKAHAGAILMQQFNEANRAE